ncbi:Lachesin [Armadillidium vulgare]|nr:Lachesin [Armadillidium vulgare]
MCQVIIDMSNRISSSINILVLQPPIIFDNSTRTIVEPMGTPVKLECYATGIPTPKVSWRRENNALLPTGGSVFRTFDALLECRVESYPPADIDWVHRSEAIVTSNNYRISQFAADDEFTDSVLTVIGVERRQYGNYTCRANNKLGVTMAHVLLEESYSPVCPPACELPYTYAGEKGVRPEFGLLLVLLWFALV